MAKGRRLPPGPRRGKNERPAGRARERLCLEGQRIALESYEVLRRRAARLEGQDSVEFKFGAIQTSAIIGKRTSKKRKTPTAEFEPEGQPRFEGGRPIVQGGLPELGKRR